MVFYAKVAPTFDVLPSTFHVINNEKAMPYIFQTSLFWSPPLIAVRLLLEAQSRRPWSRSVAVQDVNTLLMQ
jgi:hypothetical protein